jgi:hypothetical protein
MARLQILELPAIYSDEGPDETPFILVIDQASEDIVKTLYPRDDEGVSYAAAVQGFTSLSLAEQIGARAILVFEETVEIPVNETPVDPDGYPLKIRVEPDFEQFREQVEEEIRYAQGKLTRALNGDTERSPEE